MGQSTSSSLDHFKNPDVEAGDSFVSFGSGLDLVEAELDRVHRLRPNFVEASQCATEPAVLPPLQPHVSWQSGSSSSPQSTGERKFEEPNEVSVSTTDIPKTPEAVSTPSYSAQLRNPPAISFYVPRRTTPTKTKDATKRRITPHLRIKCVEGSKLLSNVISFSSSPKLGNLVKHWNDIKNLADTGQLLGVKRLELPALMSFKLVELTDSFVYLVESISDFSSCSALFEILSVITSSTFEYHKIEVMKRVVTPKFMYTLLCVVHGFHCHNPGETEFESFVENLVCIYGGVFLQLDDLATDGLAAALTKVIESCLQFARSTTENRYCTDSLDQLLCIINARDSLIRAHSCFPYDILNEESVETNIIDGAYVNFDQYLSIHYRLLKEDFQNSLREGMIQYLRTVEGGKSKMINYHLTIYPRVTLQTKLSKYALNYILLIQIQNPTSSSFPTGALLILSPRISLSNPTPFESYYLVRVEDSSPLERGKPYIFVSMILGPSEITPSMDLMMAEPNQFFEPYYRVLNVIRSLDSGTFPFLQYIVELKTDVSPPAYMKTTTKLKLGRTECSLWDDESWPNPEDVELNRVQLEGLKLALRNELAIIRGPPGTGKTYLSRKIIEVLLANRSVWHKNDDGVGLIMVVCSKNQSLDQLLGGLIKAGKKVLRVGTKSGEEVLDHYNLTTVQNPNHTSDQIYFEIRRKLAADGLILMDALVKSVYVVDELKNLRGLIKVSVLSPILHLNEVNFRYLENHMEEWLVPFPLDKVNKMEKLLITSRCMRDVDRETVPNMYLNSLQRIESELSILISRLEGVQKTSFKPKVNDDVLSLTNAITYLKRKSTGMEDGLHKLNQPLSNAEYLEVRHLKDAFVSYVNQPPIEELHLSMRWLLYRIWITDLREFHSNCIELLKRDSQNLHQRYLEIEEMLNVRKIAQCDAEVIGMTTTVAAKYHKMAECLKPKIVLVEEAAEVMEAHTIAAISKHCEHLILVGDHKQLRPMTSSHLTGRESHLEVSMYERLVRNGFPHCTLSRQYRMRPEIASLISPAVYPDLVNDASVNNLPHVLGVWADLYFMDYSIIEDLTPGDLCGMNVDEAGFHVAFCNYLLKQGYAPSQITILATYSTQEKYFIREKLEYPELKDVLIATVDSYQGKENDIILLSLVPSDAEGNIGFLALQNRINVALSRAKRGLFITGNSKNLLARGGLWQGVVDYLSRNNAIGPSIPLKCEIHRKLTLVTAARHFVPLMNGGCSTKCNMNLPCGHLCIHQCHPIDLDHRDIFKCSAICCKVMDCSHPCILTCHSVNDVRGCFCESCSPKTICETNIKCGVKLQCGHSCLNKCRHSADKDHTKLCKQVCDQLRDCGHACTLPCHFPKSSLHNEPSLCRKCNTQVDATEQIRLQAIGDQSKCAHGKSLTTKCKIKCGFTLQCGHSCLKKYGHTAYKDHNQLCKQVCGQLRDCGHACTFPCHFPKSSPHNKPSLCGKCSEKVDATEQITLQAIGDQSKCAHGKSLTTKSKIKCGVTLECGHSCQENGRHTAGINHTKFCKQVCGQLLDCGHACTLPCHFPKSCQHNKPSLCSNCSKHVYKQTAIQPNRNRSICAHGTSVSTMCSRICGFTLQCGHSCLKKYGHTADKDHTKLCRQVCGQLHDCGYTCTLRCHFPKSYLHNEPSLCKKCSKHVYKQTAIQPNRDRSRCAHGKSLTTKCKIKCGVKLQCGHSCLSKCGHTADMDHSTLCKQVCGQLLDCGHACTLPCHFPQSSLHNEPSLCRKCRKEVDKQTPIQTIGDQSKCAHGKYTMCRKICGVTLQCGHSCLSKCGHNANKDHNQLCKQVCGQLHDCGHTCTVPCNFPKSYLHNELFICFKCYKQLDKQTIIQAIGYQSKCYHGISLAIKCKRICGFTLQCGHSCQEKNRHTFNKGHTKLCKQVCDQLRDCGHACTLPCHFPKSSPHNEPSLCGKCSKRVDEQTILQAIEPSMSGKCSKQDDKNTTIQIIGDQFKCAHGKSLTIKCKIKCGVKLQCGQSCRKTCQHTADKDHTKLCKQVCGQLRDCGHACTLPCHFPMSCQHNEPSLCSKCSEKVDATEQIRLQAIGDQSKCAHGKSLTTRCKRKCGVKLQCGHSCLNKCRHTANKDHAKLCKQVCGQLHDCGHACTLPCHFPQSSPHNEPSLCRKCNTQVDEQIIIKANRDQSKCPHGMSWPANCKIKCVVKLQCGHSCRKTCGHTANKDHTKLCKQVCDQLRDCGHACTLPCHFPKSRKHNKPSLCGKCSEKVDATEQITLEAIGDQSKCAHGKSLTTNCKIKCGVKLQCGHSCQEKSRHSADKDHSKLCKQVCGQLCDCGHACTLRCHFPKSSRHNERSSCRICKILLDITTINQANRDRSNCYHGKSLKTKCKIKCGVKLQCGHSCLSKCGHTANIDHTKLCKQVCGQLLDCGHACTLPCHFPEPSLHNQQSSCRKCNAILVYELLFKLQNIYPNVLMGRH